MKILIDNGHGIQTKGKLSPNGKLLEYAYTRELARQIVATLKARGYDAELLVPEDDDIPLSERVRRTNAHCQALGKSNVLLISLHLNAGDSVKVSFNLSSREFKERWYTDVRAWRIEPLAAQAAQAPAYGAPGFATPTGAGMAQPAPAPAPTDFDAAGADTDDLPF